MKVKAILKRMLQSILFIIITTWVLLSVFIYFYQDNLIFFPNNKVDATPELIALDYEDITLKTHDGVDINAWWIPNTNSRATLLLMHGNAGNLSHRLDTIRIFHELGLSVFIIDYRGYGNSSGKPSERGTEIDAETAWQYLTDKKNIEADKIIIFGRSLGGAIAIGLAEKYNAAALIVESSFSSIADIGKHYYPYLPTALIARTKYPSKNRIKNIQTPTLFIHSQDDEIIPYSHGQVLFAAANEPKLFLEITGGHNDGFIISAEKYSNGIDAFISNILGE